MNREPTVTQIVDRVLALECGESCHVKLNPRVTRVRNLEWLLSVSVRQFGVQIDMSEQREGDYVDLMITATATRGHQHHQPVA